MIRRGKARVTSTPSETAGVARGGELSIAPLRSLAGSGAVVVAGLCCIVLAGWVFGIPWLTGPDPQHASTSVATALCFILCSAAIYLQARPHQAPVLKQLCSVFAFLTLAVACYDLATYIRGSASAGYLLGPQLGQMAPATATAFVILSLSLLVGPLARGYVQSGLVAAGLMLAMTDIVCNVYGVEALYDFAPFAAMALYTSVLFILLYVCVLLSHPDRGWI